MLMPTIPASTRDEYSRAAFPLPVKMDVAFPKRELFTSVMASSSVFTRITESTGPKISSRAMVISGRTLSKIVGPRKKPSPSHLTARPSRSGVAPSATPLSMYPSTRVL